MGWIQAATVGDLGETGQRVRHVFPNDLANVWIDSRDGLRAMEIEMGRVAS